MDVPIHSRTAGTTASFPAFSTNRLLQTLGGTDLGLLEPHLVRVPLGHKEVIIPASQPIRHVYFPEGGIIAYRSPTSPHNGQELGLVGREGMVGFFVLIEQRASRAEAVVQIDGTTAILIGTKDLLVTVRQSSTLHAHLLSFLSGHIMQLAQTTYARGYHSLPERLARLLLLCHDRI